MCFRNKERQTFKDFVTLTILKSHFTTYNWSENHFNSRKDFSLGFKIPWLICALFKISDIYVTENVFFPIFFSAVQTRWRHHYHKLFAQMFPYEITFILSFLIFCFPPSYWNILHIIKNYNNILCLPWTLNFSYGILRKIKKTIFRVYNLLGHKIFRFYEHATFPFLIIW